MTSESCVAAANVMLVEQEQESSQSDVVVNNSEECDCVELRNIKYKSMLLKKTSPKQVTKHNSNIDDFLEKERTQNK